MSPIIVLPAAIAVLGGMSVCVGWRWMAAKAPWVTGFAAVVSLAVTAFSGRMSGVRAGQFGTLECLALLALAVVTVRTAPGRRAFVAGGLAHVAVTLCFLRALGDPHAGSEVGAFIFWSLVATSAIVGALYLRFLDARRLRSIADARRRQRLNLARDLHDFVAHDVSEMVVQAQAGRYVAEAGGPAAALEALRRIEEAGLRALRSMDRAVHMLHDDERDGRVEDSENTDGVGDGPADSDDGGHEEHASRTPVPGLADLPAVAARFSGSGSADVRLALDPALNGSVPREAGSTAYRIVVEALTNVRRHAPAATLVEISVGEVGDGPERRLEVVVADDGGAASGRHGVGGANRRGGLGLPGLRDRVESLGGVLTAEPRDRGGWTLEAVIPLAPGRERRTKP